VENAFSFLYMFMRTDQKNKLNNIPVFVVIFGFLLLLNAPPSTAQVEETGSFREFMLGIEPETAYDNWLSHIVEGVSREGGYNVYIPAEIDIQTNGFGEFEFIDEDDADELRDLWRQVFSAVWMDEPDTAQNILLAMEVNYEVVYFHDTDTDRDFRIIREILDSTYVDSGFYEEEYDDVIGSFHHGWGIFVISPESIHPGIQVQVVHPNDDYIAVPFAVDLFLDADLGSFCVNGCGREVYWYSNYTNGHSLSDPSRNGNLPLQWFAEFHIDTVRADGHRDLAVQIHSYDTDSHPGRAPIQISPGGADGYPNRASRDISRGNYDWVNYCPTIAVAADYSLPGQSQVHVSNYFALWRGWGLVHAESGSNIRTNVDLPGYGSSRQMYASFDGRNRYETFDSFLHFELDELPDQIEDAGYTELDLYGGTIPPTSENWAAMLRYYESALDALVAYFDDLLLEDDTPPTGPLNLYSIYSSDNYIDLRWGERAYDPNFATYEILYDTTWEIGEDANIWSNENDANLAGQNITGTRIVGLEPNNNYGFAIRGVDYSGNQGELTHVFRAVALDTTLPEINRFLPIVSFPAGSWPPIVRCEARSTEPLRWVLLESRLDGQPQVSTRLQPRTSWQPDTWIDYEGLFFLPEDGIEAESEIQYRVRVEENSYHPHLVYEPPVGFNRFIVTPGNYVFYEELQFDNGELVERGDTDVWTWGGIDAGPRGGIDGSNAWAAVDVPRGRVGYIELPESYSLVGFQRIYFMFDHWYDTYAEYNDCYDGGAVQISRDDGESWDFIYPVGSYPSQFQGDPYDNEDAYGGSSNGWQTALFRLNNVFDVEGIRFRLLYRSANQGHGSIGWVVDNIRISSHAPQMRELEVVNIAPFGANSVSLSWTSNGADFYRIYRGTDPYQPMNIIAQTTENRYYDINVRNLEKHMTYRVAAVLR